MPRFTYQFPDPREKPDLGFPHPVQHWGPGIRMLNAPRGPPGFRGYRGSVGMRLRSRPPGPYHGIRYPIY